MALKRHNEIMLARMLDDQRIRFVIVGGINTVVGYGTYAIMVFLNIHYLVANICSTIIGVICSYILNKYFTFRSRNRSIMEICRFVSVYLFSFTIGNLILLVTVEWMRITLYLAGGINLVTTTIISWFGHKYFSFKKVV